MTLSPKRLILPGIAFMSDSANKRLTCGICSHYLCHYGGEKPALKILCRRCKATTRVDGDDVVVEVDPDSMKEIGRKTG